MAVETRLLEYKHREMVFEGFVAVDNASERARPVVLVSHAWGGRDEFAEQKARDLARLGYVGFAIDLYGKGKRGSNPDENRLLMAPLLEDRLLLQARMETAVDVARDLPQADRSKIAAIGYCFGGLCVLDLARTGSDVKAVASFHGLFTPPGNTAGRQVNARVLVLHGYDDPMADPESMTTLATELTEAGADWQIHAYGNTVHAFTNPAAASPEAGTVYSSAADKRSWRSMTDFLADSLE
ncbi:carboxymethylenebutenolidase [Chromatiales bacterium (ex Bugula neritina AB1)]|nr:carboxymethylenebutenolidase [Chromatiales bacterium (ex Bugula neritina AB1)]